MFRNRKIQCMNGVEIPQLGFGVWKLKDGAEAERAVAEAIELGYRHFDTACVYGNEKSVGRAIAASGIPRKDFFITGKLWNQSIRQDCEEEELQRSLENLRINYFDLYLIHWPVSPGYQKAWRKLEDFYRRGLCRAIGVSNFTIPQLEKLLRQSKILPAVNQIPFNPYYQDRERIVFCKDHRIQVEGWSPLGNGKAVEEEVCRKIGENYGKTPAQVILRWILQKEIIIFPKSARKERMKENMDIFDFHLTMEECAKLDQLNRGIYEGPDPNHVDF